MKCFVASCALSILPLAAFAQNYVQTNLVSDIPQAPNADGTTVIIDAHLKNAWGLARGAATPWWVNNNGTGTSTLYSGDGAITPLVVTVPNAKGVTAPSRPTGMIFNGSKDFAIAPINNPAASNPAAFIFATNNGTISAWGPPATPVTATGASIALTEVDESKEGANFVGLTWVESEGKHFLLAANFSGNKVEMFDTNFKRVHLSEEEFDDDRLPRDFAPYNVQAVGANVVVTYAKQNSAKTGADDNCGDDCGFVDVFTAKGKLLQRLEHGPWLRAPWGVALASQDFGFFSHDLLIGNRFGGTIAAFDVVSGKFLGNLLDANDAPIAIDGLWGLEFDNRGSNEAGTTATPSTGPALFFSAGINGYADGLFGTLTPSKAQLNAEDHE
ncbi:MAG TPA: TIGR03118 family protein [Steroidobacteraceae bacterium]